MRSQVASVSDSSRQAELFREAPAYSVVVSPTFCSSPAPKFTTLFAAPRYVIGTLRDEPATVAGSGSRMPYGSTAENHSAVVCTAVRAPRHVAPPAADHGEWYVETRPSCAVAATNGRPSTPAMVAFRTALPLLHSRARGVVTVAPGL